MITTTTAAFETMLATARAAAEAGDFTRARAYYRNATEIDPSSCAAWLGMAGATAVLAERRALFERALALDPACAAAREGIAEAEALLAAGCLIVQRAVPPAAPAEPGEPAAAAIAPPARREEGPIGAAWRHRRGIGLALVALTGLGTMWLLTSLGIFVLTSFWGFLLAFLAGPSVSELMLRLTARARKGLSGRPLQIAGALGMILGSVGAMALGGLLLAALGAPLPAEAVAMARDIGVGTAPALVLLNNPGLLVFVSSAVGCTVFRLR
ncbi:MAG TPA: hypothetical protein PKD53_10765 [Chloroflexaceae bacterium]|nr:hypothetical protein [Chloroflexaceae bacterium]